jgi:hypothetical protein
VACLSETVFLFYEELMRPVMACASLPGGPLPALVSGSSGAPKGGGGGLPVCSHPPHQAPQNRNLKNTDFVNIMISKVLRDLLFSRNQPLKYIRILKNKLIKLKKRRIYDTVIKSWDI